MNKNLKEITLKEGTRKGYPLTLLVLNTVHDALPGERGEKNHQKKMKRIKIGNKVIKLSLFAVV